MYDFVFVLRVCAHGPIGMSYLCCGAVLAMTFQLRGLGKHSWNGGTIRGVCIRVLKRVCICCVSAHSRSCMDSQWNQSVEVRGNQSEDSRLLCSYSF